MIDGKESGYSEKRQKFMHELRKNDLSSLFSTRREKVMKRTEFEIDMTNVDKNLTPGQRRAREPKT